MFMRLTVAISMFLLLVALSASGDTFINKKTGQVGKGRILFREMKDGRERVLVEPDGRTPSWLWADEWEIKSGQPSDGERATGSRQKWAFLFGSNAYADPRLGRLSHCGDDLAGMEDLLVQCGGFPKSHVFVYHDKQPEIKQWPMRRVLEDAFKAFVALPGPEDQVLVIGSSHGTEVDGVTYLCPMDADPDKPTVTMLRVSWLYELLERCKAAQKIVILDACRRPVQGQTRAVEVRPMSPGFAETVRDVPHGLLVLSSCVSGEVSYEASGLGHGVFLHFVLHGLSGKADKRELNPRAKEDGQVDHLELFSFAEQETRAYVAKTFNARQTPEKYGRETQPIVLTGRPVPSDETVLPTPLLTDADRARQAIALARVAVGKTEEGDVGGALAAFETAAEMANGIRLEGFKDGTLFEIAKARADAKDCAGAVNTAKSIQDEARRQSAFDYIVKAQTAAKDFSGAIQTAKLMAPVTKPGDAPASGRLPMAQALAHVVKAAAAAGEADSANQAGFCIFSCIDIKSLGAKARENPYGRFSTGELLEALSPEEREIFGIIMSLKPVMQSLPKK
jgi:uncharacterized caspase-like protein